MKQESPLRDKIVKQVTMPTVLAGVACGIFVALVNKQSAMGYVTNIVGFGIVGLIGGTVLGNIVINKSEA